MPQAQATFVESQALQPNVPQDIDTRVQADVEKEFNAYTAPFYGDCGFQTDDILSWWRVCSLAATPII